jgi:hypothetical protein
MLAWRAATCHPTHLPCIDIKLREDEAPELNSPVLQAVLQQLLHWAQEHELLSYALLRCMHTSCNLLNVCER